MAPQRSEGSRWFMIVSLLAMAAVLVLAGMHARKPAANPNAAASAQAHEPAAGESGAEAPGSGDQGAPPADAGGGASDDAAATNPEAVRNQ